MQHIPFNGVSPMTYPEGRVFQLWKDGSDHICQLGNYVVHNFQLDAKKLEFRKGNPFPAIFLKIIKGKHGFYNGRKIENFEIPFLVRKMYQYSEVSPAPEFREISRIREFSENSTEFLCYFQTDTLA